MSDLFTDLLDLPSWRLGTGDLLQQVGLLLHLHNGDSELYKIMTGSRVAYEVYNRLSGQAALEQYQAQFIMGVVDFVKKNPKASEDQTVKEVQKLLEVFKAQISM